MECAAFMFGEREIAALSFLTNRRHWRGKTLVSGFSKKGETDWEKERSECVFPELSTFNFKRLTIQAAQVILG